MSANHFGNLQQESSEKYKGIGTMKLCSKANPKLGVRFLLSRSGSVKS
jgi:hypothetical protein